MNRWDDPKSLMQGFTGGPQPKKKADESSPKKNSDVLRSLIPGQLGRLSVTKANEKLQNITKGLPK